jgi:hypothetical protein
VASSVVDIVFYVKTVVCFGCVGKKSNGQRRPFTQRNRGAGNARGHMENTAHQHLGSTAAETGGHAGRGSNGKSQNATINHSNKESGRKSRENSESDVSVASVNRGPQHGHYHGDNKADLRGHPKSLQHVNAFKEVGPNLGTNNGEPERNRADKADASRSSAKAAKSSKRQQTDNARNVTVYERNNNDVADEKIRPKRTHDKRFVELYTASVHWYDAFYELLFLDTFCHRVGSFLT